MTRRLKGDACMVNGRTSTFDSAAAEAIMRRACSQVGVSPDGLELVRLGDHAVFRLAGGEIVARVGRNADRLADMQREVAVARWLAVEEYPASRLATEAEQPVLIDAHPVTFWQSIGTGDKYATTREMGELLRRLHELEPPPFELPPLQPFDKVAVRLERAAIRPGTRDYLREMADELESKYSHLESTLASGHLHGDYNVGNVIRDTAGAPVVIDLDSFAVGLREWDLMQTAVYFDSFGWHTQEEYADFVAGYGFDVREWSGYSVLKSIRELLMVTWLSQNAGTNPRAAEEVEKRVETLRTGGSRRDWAPF